MKRFACNALLMMCVAMIFAGCSIAPKTAADRDKLHADVLTTVERFKTEDPSIKTFFDDALGWAVFPSVIKGGAGFGGAHGRGELYEGGTMTGYCDLSQATIGFQLGGQVYSEIIFFQNDNALARFKTGNFAFSAQASVVAATAGVSVDADYDKGVAVFTMAKGGLMYEASVGGQKFRFEPWYPPGDGAEAARQAPGHVQGKAQPDE